jgi:hypothetical protein
MKITNPLMQILIVIVVSCSLLGCASHMQLSDKSYGAKAPDAQIETVELTQEKRKYEVLGIVSVPLVFIGPKTAVEKLKVEARKMGADAISTPDSKYNANNRLLEAKAIRWIQ